MTTIRVADLRAAGICRNARVWAVNNGLDWRAFVLHGMPAAELAVLTDNRDAIDRVIRCAKEREAQDGR